MILSKYYYGTFLQACVVALVAGNDIYPDSGTQNMEGFAKKGGTTGGTGGPVVYVQTLNDLRKALNGNKPTIVVITKNISSSRKYVIQLGANKSLIGSWKANVIDNVYFKASPRSKNIIFQNLYLKHNVKNIGNEETQVVLDCGSHYWIDHCTFDGQKIDKKDLGKLLKVSELVDFVTISNSKFMNHEYGLIFGYPEDDPSVIEKYSNYPRVTIMFNMFQNLQARGPGLMRFGMFHVFNNYIISYHLGFTVGFQSKIYSENNYFDEPTKYFEILDDKGNGFFRDIGTKMIKKQTSKITTWNPSSDYKYTTYPMEYSRDFCSRYSGVQNQKLDFPGVKV